MSADVHGFEHAALEPEIGVIEIDPATGEIPIVVINRAQSHSKAKQAIKAWRERLVLPAPLLALLDLAKDYPLGMAVGAGAAAVVTATSVSVAAIPVPERPPPAVIIAERLEASPPSGGIITPFAITRASTAPPTSRAGRPTARRPAVPPPASRPSPSMTASPTPASTPIPEQTKPPTPPPRPQATASPSPPSQERSKQEEQESSEMPKPSAVASPQKPTLLPLDLDIDVPLIDEDPLVDAVCGLLPIGCPIS